MMDELEPKEMIEVVDFIKSKTKPKDMKQTAIEFLIKEFSDILGPLETKPMQDLLMMDAMKRAKQMEKSQMINFADDYVDNCVIPNENMAIPTKMDVPEYYEEVYGDNK